MATVGDAMLAMCGLFEEGQVVDLAAEHAAHVAELRGALAEVADAALRQKLEAYAARWTSAAIAAKPGAFYDETQVLAAELGNVGLL